MAISPSTPEEHAQLMELHGFQFHIVTDINYEFALEFGFIDLEEGVILRGYVAANPENEKHIKEVDYLVGENLDTIVGNLEDL